MDDLTHPHYLIIESANGTTQAEFSGPVPSKGDIVVTKPIRCEVVQVEWYLDVDERVGRRFMRANVRAKSLGPYQGTHRTEP